MTMGMIEGRSAAFGYFWSPLFPLCACLLTKKFTDDLRCMLLEENPPLFLLFLVNIPSCAPCMHTIGQNIVRNASLIVYCACDCNKADFCFGGPVYIPAYHAVLLGKGIW